MTKKHIIISVAIALIIIVSFFIIRDFSAGNASFSAQFADNVLRPIIGNTATIKLETFLFNTQDKLQQIVDNNSNGQEQVTSLANLTWQPVVTVNNDSQKPIIQTANVNPDPNRNYTLVHLVKIDTTQVMIGAVAGKKEPASEVGMPGTGVVPSQITQNNSLIAAFNGGFQYRDGQYGMILNGTTYLPLKPNLATFVVDKSGKINIINYNNNIDTNQYTVIRQNGEMLVENGKVIPSSNDVLAKAWGRTITSSMYTWRSGVGITTNGDLIYAVGNSLIPETLGLALQSAGAVNAMQLDINPFWVRFSIFKPTQTGYVHQSLFAKMFDGGKIFLNNDSKDFFFVYLRNPENSPSLTFSGTKNKWSTN